MAKKTVRGRASLAAKHTKKDRQEASAVTNATPTSTASVSDKTKKKVAKKLKFLQRVEKSAAASRKKRDQKKQKRKATALHDLSGLSNALEDLVPEIHKKALKGSSTACRNAPKYKKSGSRLQLQLKEQDRMVAVLQTDEYKADPVKALTDYLNMTLSPPEAQKQKKSVGTKLSKKEKRARKKRSAAEDEDVSMQ